MKHWIKVCLLLVIGMPWTSVNASNFSTTLSAPTSILQEQSFILTVSVTGVSSLFSYEADIDYDRTKLTVTNDEPHSSDFDVSVGTKLIVDYKTVQSGNFLISEIPFKATSQFKPGESTTIRLFGVSGSNGSSDLEGLGASVTITMSELKSSNANLASLSVNQVALLDFNNSQTVIDLGMTENASLALDAVAMDDRATVSGTGLFSLSYGKQSFVITVTAEDGTQKVYTVRIDRKDTRSTNNFLRSLQLSSGEIQFNKEMLTYNITVENSVQFLRVVSTPEDGRAKVIQDATYPLEIYNNQIQIVVTAENGDRRVYALIVSRKDSEGNIGDLSKIRLAMISIEGYSIDFSPNVLEYEIQVGNHVNSLLIIAVAEDDSSSISIEGHTQLRVGKNDVKIDLITPLGLKKTYKIFVDRMDALPVLTLLNLNEFLENSTIPIIQVQLESEYILSKELLQSIRRSGKTVYFFKKQGEKILYGWYIDGSELQGIDSIDLFVELNPSDKEVYLKAGNYSDMVIAIPRQQTSFPKNTRLQINVKRVFDSVESIHIYHFEENQFEMIKQNVLVQSGMVEFDYEVSRKIVLANGNLIETKRNPWVMPILILEGVLIVGFGLYVILTRNKKRVQKS